MDVMLIIVYAVAVLLVGSVVLFVKAAFFDRRPQKIGLLWALLAIPLFMIYYQDRGLFSHLDMRRPINPLTNLVGADIYFHSAIAPSLLIGGLMLFRLTVFQRVAVRNRLARVHDQTSNFFALTTAATLLGAVLVSTFRWGWQGALGVTVAFSLIYLGALALLGALLEVTLEVSKLISVWIKRKIFSVGTAITKVASWVSSLSGRLVPGNLIERIREDKEAQESIFRGEQEDQDQQLASAHERYLTQGLGRKATKVPEQGAASTQPAPEASGDH